MTRKVFFWSCETRFFTFSNMKARGLLTRRISFISKNSVPWVSSSNPCFLPMEFFFETPASENG
jgi:hypothetical protein